MFTAGMIAGLLGIGAGAIKVLIFDLASCLHAIQNGNIDIHDDDIGLQRGGRCYRFLTVLCFTDDGEILRRIQAIP